MLSTEDKNAIQQSGEIIRQIDFNDPARESLLKGKLRILRTDNPQIFNFVEVGEWLNYGQHATTDESAIVEFRDRLVYDDNGNTISRRIFEKCGEELKVKEDWSSEVIDGRFLQHVKIYENGRLVAEFTRNVLNYLEPKSDSKKDKIPFGTDRGYYPDGRLAYVRSYDVNGNLLKEETHER